MCDDIEATVAELSARGVEFTEPVSDQGWGLVTRMRIAEGETLGMYSPGTPARWGVDNDRVRVAVG